ncbi:MAG TPA: hypothetical protein VK174_05045, partial [Chitinophagales bacterium]|nr:hypothetical protein [Chitinophagales bacterium]
LYWMASDACYSLAWLNYKLAPLRKLFDNEQRFISPSGNDTFSVQGYAGRVKLLLKADNRFIERSALLLNEKYEKSFNRTVGYINAINTCYHAVKPDGKLLVLIIPHCSRVNDRYKADYEKLGAQFRDKGDHPSWGFLMGVLCKFNAQSLLSVSHYLNMAEEQGIQTYYYSDEHLTANGQKVVCSAVLNHLP